MSDDLRYFVLFANCLLVKGYIKSTICDIQRSCYKVIPNLLHDILLDNRKNGYSLTRLFEIYRNEDQGLKLYLDLLQKESYGFVTDLNPKKYFPDLSLKYEHFGKISNSIIDFNNRYDHRLLQSFIQHLNINACAGVQLRFFSNVDLNIIEEILSYFNDTEIPHLEIFVKYSNSEREIIRACLNNQRVGSLVFHGYSKEKKVTEKLNNNILEVRYSEQDLDSCESCGVINSNYFIVEQTSFLESLSYNSCLNEKVSIDEHGFIKNCPSMREAFGNIKQKYEFEEIIDSSKFREYWKITKDKIQDCKVCEFRHMCQDCRAYTRNSKNKISKPLKCNYDPYKGVYSS